MKKYLYKNYLINRKKNVITIENKKKEVIKKIILNDENSLLGKLNIPLSNICTMKCDYCSEAEYMDKDVKVTKIKDAELIIDYYVDYIKENNEVNEVKLSFDYGGEPTCQLQTLEYISKYFKKSLNNIGKKARVEVTTNGIWPKEYLSRLLNSADEIIISIDGYKKLHEKYRKHKNGDSFFEEIINNAVEIYKYKKLKQISSVITIDTINNVEQYIEFFVNKFSGVTLKMNPIIIAGNAKKNNLQKIPLPIWRNFIIKAKKIANGKIKILDSRPDKSIFNTYYYGCEHMKMINWFYWLDGNITCCTDRDQKEYIIGINNNGNVSMNYKKMKEFAEINKVDNIQKCSKCLAKYYCAGGCPIFRDGKINCDRRIEKYAKMLIEKI